MTSYAALDPVRWIEGKRNFVSLRKRKNSDGMPVGWATCPAKLNPFQARAVHILGIVGSGIYNAPIDWDAVRWTSWFIDVPWDSELSTFDNRSLTWLVFLAHEARIRVSVRARSSRRFEINLSERSDEGPSAVRHPNLDEAIADLRIWLEAGHAVVYASENGHAAKPARPTLEGRLKAIRADLDRADDAPTGGEK